MRVLYPEGARTAGYDRVSTMFSPKGRLYQVEYASKIVEQGTLGLGMVYDNGVLLAADKHITSELVLPESIEKLFKVDEHIGALSSGLVGDARRLIKIARQKAQENIALYEEKIPVLTLAREVSSIKQVFTQYAGIRPFGVSLIIAGVDDGGRRLFETEPSGALAEYKAVAIGSGKKKAMQIMEKKYREKMSRDDAVLLALEIIKQAQAEKMRFDLRRLDFAFMEKNIPFKKIPLNELKTILGK